MNDPSPRLPRPPQSSAREWLALLRFEYSKLFGRWITYLPFVVITIVCLLICTVFHHLQFKIQMGAFNKLFNLAFTNKEQFVNGYYMTAHAMNPTLQLLVPIFISVASGMMVAGEAETGTLRACLIRPVTRRRLILGKFIVLATYTLALCAYLLTLLVTLGITNFGTGNLYTINLLFNNGQEGASTVLQSEMPYRLVCACLMATFGLTVLAALALLISSMSNSTAVAYVTTLSIYFSCLAIRSFPFLDWLYPYLFVTHIHRWQQCFYGEMRLGEISTSCIHLAGYLIGLLVAASLLFEERDITS